MVAVKLVEDPLVADSVDAKKYVLVTFVNTPVDATDAPIGVLSILPPLMVSPSTTKASVMLFDGSVNVVPIVKLLAVILVPDAVPNERFVPNKLVEVTLVPLAFVKVSPVEKKLVEVAFVEVTLVNVEALKVVRP